MEGHRVGLLPPLVVGAEDHELVVRAGADVGHEQLPDAGDAELPHRVLAAVPAVEVALDADALGVRRPHRERRAGDRRRWARRRAHVRAQHVPELLVAALVDQVQVDLARGWAGSGRGRRTVCAEPPA